ncbi:large subunit GTPase 1 homolog [Daphnia carinata]|uniref:large subunit GTPase 1 homolog n=1 Tax=Daphnia carinata TaxID=120202 RepID=UPI00257D6B8B|nr:large subunit GTPase 1 homolog [Daphnia carinata]
MGKKTSPLGGKKGIQLGRAIIKDRFGKGKGKSRKGDPTMLHTSELDDGYDWGRLNLQSVTEQSQLDEFLATAELAGTEFAAEKLNVTFAKTQATYGLLSAEEKSKVKLAQAQNAANLKIPRRPLWDRTTSGEELQQLEREAFLAWRKGLSELQEIEGVTLTPYEKNLDFWRQLWRVIERSDVVVQIVDARNPMLFRCEDLERYVVETSQEKMNLILINKADFLSEKQRQLWAEYFDSINLPVAFFSALEENQNNQLRKLKLLEEEEEITEEEIEGEGEYENEDEEENEEEEEIEEEDAHEEDTNVCEDGNQNDKQDEKCSAVKNKPDTNQQITEKKISTSVEQAKDTKNSLPIKDQSDPLKIGSPTKNSTRLLSGAELVELFKNIHKGRKVQEGRSVVGLVGYPNVGKSSTINSLLTYKKVSVSATPGKTKHFQTINIDDDLILCDCPGLVMPSFVSTKHEMVIWGILPIDQMRDHVGPVNLIASLIPRSILESTYGIFIPKPSEGEDANRSPTSEELLNAYGFMRGFMTARGLPDNPRASRYILKDFVQGKLLYCNPPPETDASEFQEFTRANRSRPLKPTATPTPFQLRVTKTNYNNSQSIDQAFFSQSLSTAHSKGRASTPGETHTKGVTANLNFPGSCSNLNELGDKPWKKHNKKHKREKLRRVYAHLDQ